MKDYTLGSLIEAVKRRLNNDEYEDDDIIDYLNQAQREVLGEDKYPFLEKIDDYEDIGDGELNLPLDYQATKDIYAVDTKGIPHKMRYVTVDEYASNQVPDPYAYTIYANKVFVGLPDDVELLRVKHFYLAKPTTMSDESDEPIIPEEFSEILILGALARAERSRDNFDYAALYENNMANLILNMKFRYGLKNTTLKARSRPNGGRRFGGCSYAQQ